PAAAGAAGRRHRVSPRYRAGARGSSQPGPEGGNGGAAQDTERVALERQYLRLLRCYPPSHREVHGEEMLGVLLDAARPGQRTPGLRQTVNLAACGLMIRAHRIPGWLTDDRWQDALAVVSLIAPAVMFIVATLDFATAVQEAVNAAAMAPI